MENREVNRRKAKPIKKFTNRMSARLMLVFAIVLVLMSLLIVRIVELNRTDGVRYEKRVLSQQTYTSRAIPFQRGSILDRNGTVLAYSEKVYNVVLDVYYALSDDKYSEATKKAIVSSFEGVTEKDIDNLYTKKQSSRYSVIKKSITYENMEKFKELEKKDKNIQGVWFEEDYKRKYPYKTLASVVLGFTTNGSIGNWGIEQFYNDTLNGTNGIEFGYIDSDLKLERTVKPSINGNSIVSTIDANVQKAVQEHINAFNEEYGSRNMGVLVMNPNNGEILAMASNADYDLNNPTDLTPFYTKEEIDKMSDKEKTDALSKVWRNYTISDAYEPGSTFKPFTIAAGLEENIIKPDDTYYCDGVEVVGGTPIHCSNRYGHGEITLTQALMLSCNDALMQIGAKEGGNLFYGYQKYFGFGVKTGIDLPGEAIGQLIEKNKLNPVELATSSFGQSFTTSMVQLASGFSSLVNGGYYYQPHVMKEVLNASGGMVSAYDKKLVKLSVSSATSDFLRNALYMTVQEGTAKGAQVPGYKVGGKTGTAQKYPRAAKTYLVSFVGCVPTDNPQVVIYVVIDEPQNVIKQADSKLATTAAGEILKEILPLLGIYPTENIPNTGKSAGSETGQTAGTTENSGSQQNGQSGNQGNGNQQAANEQASNEQSTQGKSGTEQNGSWQNANGNTGTAGSENGDQDNPDAIPDTEGTTP